jgi:predicted phosphodiesterase
MKIAVLADIHGNHLALEAVLTEVKRLGIEQLFVLGDFVGYYHHPDIVMKLLDPWKKEMIKGNHEVMLEKAGTDPSEAEKIRKQYGKGIDSALDKLSKTDIDMLAGLPFDATLTIDDVNFRLCHGSPWDPDCYIYPDAPEDVLGKCAVPDADFVLMGHTHHPFVFRTGTALVANVGAVGLPRDGGGMASWAVIDTANKAMIFKKTQYDFSDIIEEVKEMDPDLPQLHEVFRR